MSPSFPLLQQPSCHSYWSKFHLPINANLTKEHIRAIFTAVPGVLLFCFFFYIGLNRPTFRVPPATNKGGNLLTICDHYTLQNKYCKRLQVLITLSKKRFIWLIIAPFTLPFGCRDPAPILHHRLCVNVSEVAMGDISLQHWYASGGTGFRPTRLKLPTSRLSIDYLFIQNRFVYISIKVESTMVTSDGQHVNTLVHTGVWGQVSFSSPNTPHPTKHCYCHDTQTRLLVIEHNGMPQRKGQKTQRHWTRWLTCWPGVGWAMGRWGS